MTFGMEQIEFHPIACESCRNKKSKCDRELPNCSQCTASGTNCRYPTANKRGIPSGYISFIEQRLLETELALFELLTTVYNAPTSIATYRSQQHEREAIADYNLKQPKTTKIQEWKGFQLATDEQRRIWWQKQREIIHGQRNQIGDPSSRPAQDQPPRLGLEWPDAQLQSDASQMQLGTFQHLVLEQSQSRPPCSRSLEATTTWHPALMETRTPETPVRRETSGGTQEQEQSPSRQWRKYF